MRWITLSGLMPYSSAIELMETRLIEVINKQSEQCIYLLEHEDVYTAGTSSNPDDLLQQTDIPVVSPGRGGQFTYHGPGQRVIYPVLDLKQPPFNQDLKRYVRFLEQWMINIASCYKLDAKTFDDSSLVGVWVNTNKGPSKLAAIGIRVKKWVSYHGVAFNLSTDLIKYQAIVPCGIQGLGVTSLQQLGISTTKGEWDAFAKQEFHNLLDIGL